jgi:hypothetical protein
MYYGAAKPAGLGSAGMSHAFRRLEQLLPTLVMASGVMLLTVGALAFAPPRPATPPASPAAGDPLFDPGASAQPPGVVIDIGSPLPTSSSSPRPPGERAVASRIRIASLAIDLPVIAGDASEYPPCDVASYAPDLSQPGEHGTTYIYAHAQKGMFLPLLRASLLDDGAALVGALVEVFTSDAQLHLYAVTTVKRHATDLSIVDGSDQLVLQTSEGPPGTVPKLQVAAVPLSEVPVSAAEARPPAEPRACRPQA